MSTRTTKEDRVALSIANVVLFFIGAVIFMLFLGAAHSTAPEIPAWGFDTCVFLAAGVRAVLPVKFL